MIGSEPYRLLPFSFDTFKNNEYLVINSVGEFLFLSPTDFLSFVHHKLDKNSETFLDLKGKHFLADTDLVPAIELLATKYRTKKAYLRNFTALHMIVITARCNHRCRYCHASSEDVGAVGWDMPPDIARKVVDTIFQTPSPSIKIEFQGGEPLLNWTILKEIVQHSEKLNKKRNKELEFVICTNLTLIDAEKLSFIKDHRILISTSLDGPKNLHDTNRIMRNSHSSYDLFINKLALTREYLGEESVSALMTTSIESLGRMREIIDEYASRGFNGIFMRALNPFGFARADYKLLGYEIESFVEAYKNVLSYLIKLNLRGVYFEEFYTSLLLTRILTPFSTGFVDFQSPSGAGISGAIYDRNGDVYPCDEGRMLAKSGDQRFLLGNVMQDSFLDMFGGTALRDITNSSCVEVIPGCSSCVYQIYCGADPIRNYAEQNDLMGHKPKSSFCRKNKAIFEHLFQLFRENDSDVMDVFWSWITRRSLKDIRNVELPRKAS